MGEAKRRQKFDPNWGKRRKNPQNSEAGTTDDCHFNLSLEKSFYWVNAINTYETSDETMKFMLELATISPFFHQELIKFLRFIWEHSSENPNKLCFLNILKDAFQACTCFNNDKPEEIKEELGFLLFVENKFKCYWMFPNKDFKEFVENLELCLPPN